MPTLVFSKWPHKRLEGPFRTICSYGYKETNHVLKTPYSGSEGVV